MADGAALFFILGCNVHLGAGECTAANDQDYDEISIAMLSWCFLENQKSEL